MTTVLFSEELEIGVMNSQEMVGMELAQEFQDTAHPEFIEGDAEHEIPKESKIPDLVKKHQNDINAEGVTKPLDDEAPKAPDIAVKICREVEATAVNKHQQKDYSCRYEATVAPVSPPCSHQSTQVEKQAAFKGKEEQQRVAAAAASLEAKLGAQQEKSEVAVELKTATHVVKFEGNDPGGLERSTAKDHEIHHIAQDDKEGIRIMGEGARVHTPSSIEFYDTREMSVNNIIPSSSIEFCDTGEKSVNNIIPSSSIELYDTGEKLVNNIIPSEGFVKPKPRLFEKYVHNEKGLVSSEPRLHLPRNHDPAGGAPIGDKYIYSKFARASQFVYDNGKLAQYDVGGVKHPTQQDSDTFDLEQQFGDLQQARVLAKFKSPGPTYVRNSVKDIGLGITYNSGEKLFVDMPWFKGLARLKFSGTAYVERYIRGFRLFAKPVHTTKDSRLKDIYPRFQQKEGDQA